MTRRLTSSWTLRFRVFRDMVVGLGYTSPLFCPLNVCLATWLCLSLRLSSQFRAVVLQEQAKREQEQQRQAAEDAEEEDGEEDEDEEVERRRAADRGSDS